MDTKSLVELMAVETHQNCSYCSSPEGSAESWLQTMQISPEHYQMLLDRGWRRIGFFICKPIVDKSCCRQYAIRSEALNYKLTRSQKRVLKRMRKFLMTSGNTELEKWTSRDRYSSNPGQKDDLAHLSEPDGQGDKTNSLVSIKPPTESRSSGSSTEEMAHQKEKSLKKLPCKGLGPDPDKPPCLKSKVRRIVRKGGTAQHTSQGSGDPSETLRSLIPHLNSSDCFKRKLKVIMVPAVENDPYFQSTAIESFQVFKQFQMTVLKEPESEWSFFKWCRCFVNCPVPHDFSGTGPGYGNFHQQYILDGKIIAVGVITLIPSALVTEYFYYDPNYGFLTLGIYSAISEICFMNELYEMDKRWRQYYIGAYTHSSPKMRYKLQFAPSELLCPHTYKWIPLSDCLPFLESGRPRLSLTNEEDHPNSNDMLRTTFDMDKLLVCYEWDNMTYSDYVQGHFHSDGENSDSQSSIDSTKIDAEIKAELEILKEYVALVGDTCATSIPLRVPATLYPL